MWPLLRPAVTTRSCRKVADAEDSSAAGIAVVEAVEIAAAEDEGSK
jgi:hypothetical protein